MGYKDNSTQPDNNPVYEKGDVVMLFETKTCPNCKTVKKILKDHNIDYEEIDCMVNEELVDKYNIMSAPTLVIRHDEEYLKLTGLNSIMEYYQ